MKRLIALILFLAPLAHGAYRTSSGSGANAFVTATTYPCTVGINPNIGDLFVVGASGGQTSGALTIAGGGVTTWHTLPTSAGQSNGAANNVSALFYGTVTTANTTLATVTNTSGSFLGGSACGLWTNATIDQGGAGTFHTVVGPSTTGTTPAITTTQAVEDIISYHRTSAGFTSSTAPFTSIATVTFSGSPFTSLNYETVSSIQTSLTSAVTMTSGEDTDGIASFYTPSVGVKRLRGSVSQ